ncbi:MAG TPA: hydantoinase/oxoprolinase family protein [Candidatus Gallacutalibacter stercoravium]|nr:hydantoinase/oxoprolinase family protein [Candidatus Gallacutalibacter stercoravium]
MKLGIGIDTGGTCTDAVLYDFEKRQVVASAKALTTKGNLAQGICNALDGLPRELATQAGIVGLSTTLATNACVEDKGGRARLAFWGVDERVVEECGKNYGLPPKEEIYFQKSYAGTSTPDRQPDWDLFLSKIPEWFCDCDAVATVEINAAQDGAAVEKKAKELLTQRLNVPVICGHELFSDINSLQRGSSALLNARLIPVIQEFLQAMGQALEQRGIQAPMVIVRSDGTLMSQSFTENHPVETLLCGPAASVMGATALCDEKDCLVVDMGGTTTDVAMVRGHLPVMVNDGIRVGAWRTFVKGLFIDTFALGGDSAVRFRNGAPVLEAGRVVPLCVAAAQYPAVRQGLAGLVDSGRTHTHFLHEFFLPVRDISNSSRYTDEEKRFCAQLCRGPLSLEQAAASMQRDVYNFKVDRLEREGVVIRCGFTPTDVMHIKGDFVHYDTQASLLGAKFIAGCVGMSVNQLCDWVYDEVTRKLYHNLARILLQDKLPYFKNRGLDEGVTCLLDDAYESAKRQEPSFITGQFTTRATLIGVGAPTHIFLPRVAALLGTKAIIPEHAGVANAVGAVVGNVAATCQVEILPDYDTDGLAGYVIQNGSGEHYDDLQAAREAAAQYAQQQARQQAIQRGAAGELTVTVNWQDQNAQAKDCVIYLGTTVAATAVGRIAF